MYRVAATAVGGRDGHVRSEDGIIDMELKTPKMMGGKGGATNPEELFAAGYAACFNSALNLSARIKRMDIGESSVTVTITLGKNSQGQFQLAARIDAEIPGVGQEEAKELVEQAHMICPYSRAIQGNVDVELYAKAEEELEAVLM